MTLRWKLLGGFGAVMALLLFPGLFAAERLAELQRLAVEGRSRQATALLSVGRMHTSLSELDRLERSYVATGDVDLRRSAADAMDELTGEYARLAQPPYASTARAIGPALTHLTRLVSEVDSLMDAGQLERATSTFLEMEPAIDGVARSLNAVADSINAAAQQDFAHAEDLSASARMGTLFGTALGLLIALAVAGWAATTLTRPLHALGRAMARVADGQFDAHADLPSDRRDEIGELPTSFEVMARRLAELDRLKAEFVGVASHELKTPINTIHGYAELIQEEYGPTAPDEFTRMVDGIADQARNLAALVDRLMDLSRLEAGAYQMHWEAVHVQDLTTGLLRRFELLARRESVALTSEVLPGAPTTVVMDLDLVRDEVLGNLVSNALRHTPAGGRVEVTVGGVEDGVVFQVRDSGPGIPEEKRDLIFRKYYRVDSTSPGSGLGLAIARETVHMHGGVISLEPSPDGWGACFRVVLPCIPPAARAAGFGPEPAADARLPVRTTPVAG